MDIDLFNESIGSLNDLIMEYKNLESLIEHLFLTYRSQFHLVPIHWRLLSYCIAVDKLLLI